MIRDVLSGAFCLFFYEHIQNSFWSYFLGKMWVVGIENLYPLLLFPLYYATLKEHLSIYCSFLILKLASSIVLNLCTFIVGVSASLLMIVCRCMGGESWYSIVLASQTCSACLPGIIICSDLFELYFQSFSSRYICNHVYIMIICYRHPNM